MLTVACVLKTGGDFDVEYVYRLKKAVEANVTERIAFVVFTDIEIKGIDCIGLIYGFENWWAKLELFRLKNGPVLYFDLDTMIVSNIDDLVKYAMQLKKGEFAMLEPFNPQRRAFGWFASGVMAWNGNFEYITAAYDGIFHRYGDQMFIQRHLQNKKVAIKKVNEAVKFVSYKRDCLAGIPKDAPVVCFHGKPRPHEVKELWDTPISGGPA